MPTAAELEIAERALEKSRTGSYHAINKTVKRKQRALSRAERDFRVDEVIRSYSAGLATGYVQGLIDGMYFGRLQALRRLR